MAFTEPPPKPPDPIVRRYDANGKPTQAQIEYETLFYAWLKRLAASIP